MLAYLDSRTPFHTTGRLFTFQSGSFLTRGRLPNETRLLLSKGGLNSGEFAGHSFRIGAATTAASANLPPWLIKVLGRWSSDCFERYIKTPPSVLAQVPQTKLTFALIVFRLCRFEAFWTGFCYPVLTFIIIFCMRHWIAKPAQNASERHRNTK